MTIYWLFNISDFLKIYKKSLSTIFNIIENKLTKEAISSENYKSFVIYIIGVNYSSYSKIYKISIGAFLNKAAYLIIKFLKNIKDIPTFILRAKKY